MRNQNKTKVKPNKYWLQEAMERNYEKIPNTRLELSKIIDELRYRLVIIANYYGHRSKETLTYSQFLDNYIAKFQVMK